MLSTGWPVTGDTGQLLLMCVNILQ